MNRRYFPTHHIVARGLIAIKMKCDIYVYHLQHVAIYSTPGQPAAGSKQKVGHEKNFRVNSGKVGYHKTYSKLIMC